MTFVGNSVKVVGTAIVESDPTVPPLPNGQEDGEFTTAFAGKVFPPVDRLMIIDGANYVVFDDLFPGYDNYVIRIDENIEPVPPVQGNVTYNSIGPWVLKGEAVVEAPAPKRKNWVLPLLAGLFLISRK